MRLRGDEQVSALAPVVGSDDDTDDLPDSDLEPIASTDAVDDAPAQIDPATPADD